MTHLQLMPTLKISEGIPPFPYTPSRCEHELYTMFYLKKKNHWEDLGIGGICKRILKRQDGRLWTQLIWLKTGICCECGNELLHL